MIYIQLKGRLGNQMFIYAFAYALSRENNNELICIAGEENGNSLSNYCLQNIASGEIQKFHFSFFQRLTLRDYSIKEQKYDRIEFYKYEDRNKIQNQRQGLYLCQNGFLPLKRCNSKKTDIYLNGYFQSEKYFSNYKEEIKSILTPINPVMNMNINLYKEICEAPDAVCVDFRLGDYLNNSLHGICTLEYYKKAMDYISQKLTNPIFYIFSTDIDIIEKEIQNWNYNIVVENGKSPDYEKLRLMSSCKHFIITNSTYDWWAQYLSNNDNKIVIAPSRWFGLPCPCDIYLDNWTLIDP